MARQIDVCDFLLNAATSGRALDVRSPGEFAAGHIPGAINVPLFSNDQRADVGLCYKESGHDAAVLLGLEIVGPKMRKLAEDVVAATENTTPLLHCWRGGMRSQSMAWLTEQVGREPLVLRGGYKAFRSAAHATFEAERRMIVLSGMTGAGKTSMLYALRDAGEQIIDLEGLAHHRGSSFGALGLPPQPTVEQFENDLFMQLRELDSSRVVWLEDESPSIGKVRVPHEFWTGMRRSPAIFLDIDRETRARNLVDEYGEQDVAGLQSATERLQRRLGGLRTQKILAYLDVGDMYHVAYELLEYYDKTYQHASQKRPRAHVHSIAGELVVERLIEFSRERCAA